MLIKYIYSGNSFPVSEDSEYRIFYPWRHGTLNEADYSSLNAVLGDLEAIWASVIQSELEIEKSDFKVRKRKTKKER